MVTALLIAWAMPGSPAPAAQPSTIHFNDAQVAEGRGVYARACGACHGPNLEGAAAVGLAGMNFARSWGEGQHDIGDLYVEIAKQMPKNAPGSLSETENLAVLAYLLSANGYTASGTPLVAASLHGTLPATGAASSSSSATSVSAFPQLPDSIEVSSTRTPVDDDLVRIKDGDWLTYNRTLSGDRFSPLAQINTRNAGRLELQCQLKIGERGSFETSPIAYDGRLFITTVHKVVAVDGSNCAVLWTYDYVPTDREGLPNNRGVALYRGKVLRGTIDGHLIALDAATGKLLWNVRVGDARLGYEITGAPVAFDGKVFTGDAGADVGINGRVYAFDVNTGALIWAFNIIPTGKQPGADTWGDGAAHGGGATWSSMSIDVQKRLLLVPTGNPAPDFNDELRPGANLYTDAVIALDLETGKLAWYVQQVPHDIHDWDTAAAPALFRQDGRNYMAVTSKNGLLFIYDRDSQQVLSTPPFTTRENVDAPLVMGQRVHVCPGALGQFNGPAYSPTRKLLFVGAADRCNMVQKGEAKYLPGSVYFGGVFIIDPPEKQSGWIKAFDPATGHEIWSVHRPSIVLSAVTPTGGDVLLTGDSGGEFLALDARTGKTLYQFATGGPIAAGITTYLAKGRQLIAVPSGSSSRDNVSANAAATLMVFALPK
jgi:PQQ-dependent dehydrogenase (methanol/ethanol family)